MKPAVLVGMLWSGEQEHDQAVAALKGQTFAEWELLEFENLPNKQAHDELYDCFMQEAGNFTHFLKLDADMVFRRDTALGEMVEIFGVEAECDWLMLDVHDWYSDMLIPGIQMFSNRARWPVTGDALIVDRAAQIPGRAVRLWQHPAPVVDHSPDPSPLQAFRFGVHRMIKALQPDREARLRSPHRGFVHWTILDHTWRHFKTSGDRRLALTIAGAEFALQEETARFEHTYTHPRVTAAFHERFEKLSAEALVDYIDETWNVPLVSQGRWIGKLQVA